MRRWGPGQTASRQTTYESASLAVLSRSGGIHLVAGDKTPANDRQARSLGLSRLRGDGQAASPAVVRFADGRETTSTACKSQQTARFEPRFGASGGSKGRNQASKRGRIAWAVS